MKSSRFKQQHGFTLTQMLFTIAIIAIVSTFGFMGIRTARAEYRLQSSARLFATYIEKARADSVRRHAAGGDESWVRSADAGGNTYTIRMDFGSGTVETRTFTLDPGLEFATASLLVTFDWRGRLTQQCVDTLSCVFQVNSPFLDKSIPVDVSGSGDITVDSQHFPDGQITDPPLTIVSNLDVDPSPGGTPAVEPTPPIDPVDPVDPIDPIDPVDPGGTGGTGGTGDTGGTGGTDPSPTPTPHGNGNGGTGDNNGNGNGNASPTPTPTPGSGQCVATISPSSLKLSQSDTSNLIGTAVFTMTGESLGTTRIITATQQGNGNSLVIEKSLSRIDGSGSSVIKITTKNGAGNRGVFTVNVSAEPSCGSTQVLTVTVNN